MDSFRENFADLFRQVYQCPFIQQCRNDDPHLGKRDTRLGRTRGPQPGFLGKNYAPQKIALVGKNPGVDGKGNFLQNDKHMYELFDEFAKDGVLNVFDQAMDFLAVL